MEDNIIIQFGRDIFGRIKVPLFLTAIFVLIVNQWQAIILLLTSDYKVISQDQNSRYLNQAGISIDKVFLQIQNSFWENSLSHNIPFSVLKEKDFFQEGILLFLVSILLLSIQYLFLFVAKKAKALYMKKTISIDIGAGGDFMIQSLGLKRELEGSKKINEMNLAEIVSKSDEIRNLERSLIEFEELDKFIQQNDTSAGEIYKALAPLDPAKTLIEILKIKYSKNIIDVFQEFLNHQMISYNELTKVSGENFEEMRKSGLFIEASKGQSFQKSKTPFTLTELGQDVLKWLLSLGYISQ